jgi:predicted phosphatase
MSNSNSKANTKQKLILRSTNDGTVRLPIEWLEVLKWSQNSEIIVSNAFWDRNQRCHKITLEKLDPKGKKTKGRWAK